MSSDPARTLAAEDGVGAARVTVVIPNWNGVNVLPACLQSLRLQTFQRFETVVVDNGSQDDSLDLLAKDFPEVRVIALAENRGFAGGVNVGIQASSTEYVALLNNDTEAAPDWLSAAVAALDGAPEASFAASKILDFERRTVLDSIADRLSVLGVPVKVGRNEVDVGQFDARFAIMSACAAASFYRRRLFDDVGFFDEDFFAYVEDLDIGVRATLAGHKGISIPEARVYHIGSSSSGGGPSAFTIRLTTRNILWMMVKCLPAPLLAVMLPLSISVQMGFVAHTLLTGRRPWFRRNLIAYWTGLKEAAAGLPAVLRKRSGVKRRIGALAFGRFMMQCEACARASPRLTPCGEQATVR
jgi:GT2 family glycosyltransferase